MDRTRETPGASQVRPKLVSMDHTFPVLPSYAHTLTTWLIGICPVMRNALASLVTVAQRHGPKFPLALARIPTRSSASENPWQPCHGTHARQERWNDDGLDAERGLTAAKASS